MTAPTINGHDHAKGCVVTAEADVHAHASSGDQRGKRPQGPESGQSPMFTRAIPRDSINGNAHGIKEILASHVGPARHSLTHGWAMTYQLPTAAEAARQLRPTSRWYAWPVDVPANLLTLAVILLTYLTVNALGTERRRRVALALAILAAAIPTTTRLLA